MYFVSVRLYAPKAEPLAWAWTYWSSEFAKTAGPRVDESQAAKSWREWNPEMHTKASRAAKSLCLQMLVV